MDGWKAKIVSRRRISRDVSRANSTEVAFRSTIGRGPPWSLNGTVEIKQRRARRGVGGDRGESELSTSYDAKGEWMGLARPVAIEGEGSRRYNRMILVRWSILYARTSPVGLSITGAFDPSFLPFFLTFFPRYSSRASSPLSVTISWPSVAPLLFRPIFLFTKIRLRDVKSFLNLLFSFFFYRT